MTPDTQHLHEKLCYYIFLHGRLLRHHHMSPVHATSNSSQLCNLRYVVRMSEKFSEQHGYASQFPVFGLPSGQSCRPKASLGCECYCYSRALESV